MSVMFNKLPDWLSGCVIVPSGYRVTAKQGGERREERRGGKKRKHYRGGKRLDLNGVKDTQRISKRPLLVTLLLEKN